MGLNIPFIAGDDFNIYQKLQTPEISSNTTATHVTINTKKTGSLRLSFGTIWRGSTYSITFYVKKNGVVIFSFNHTTPSTSANTYDINVTEGDVITIESNSGYYFGRYLTNIMLKTQYTLPTSISKVEVKV